MPRSLQIFHCADRRCFFDHSNHLEQDGIFAPIFGAHLSRAGRGGPRVSAPARRKLIQSFDGNRETDGGVDIPFWNMDTLVRIELSCALDNRLKTRGTI
jgi:hypothetical protein